MSALSGGAGLGRRGRRAGRGFLELSVSCSSRSPGEPSTLRADKAANMLTDSNVEEFEIKEDEPWYDHQDLQQGEPERPIT